MFVKFIKEHPAGIKEGRIVETSVTEGKGYIKEKYAEESTKEAFDKFKSSGGSVRSGASITDFKKRSKEARQAVNGTKKSKKGNNQKPKSEADE